MIAHRNSKEINEKVIELKSGMNKIGNKYKKIISKELESFFKSIGVKADVYITLEFHLLGKLGIKKMKKENKKTMEVDWDDDSN